MAVLLDTPISANPGTYEFERNLDKESGFLIISVARCTTATPTIWPDAGVTFLLSADLSFDHGQTWVEWLPSFGGYGGILVGSFKGTVYGEIPATSISVPLPAGAKRVRVRATVAGGPIVTNLTVERVDG